MTIEEARQVCRELGVPVPHHSPLADDAQAIVELIEAVELQGTRLMMLRNRLERQLAERG